MRFKPRPERRRFRALPLLLVLAGCASHGSDDAGDPLESINRPLFAVSETIDRVLLRPLAQGYRFVVPNPLRTGVRQAFANLRSLDSALNGLLQGKPASAGTDAARFLINSTLGFGGLFDPAAANGLLPQQEDFGQTLAVWGVGETPYLYLPIVGPGSLRDLPVLVGRQWPAFVLLGEHYNGYVLSLDLISQRSAALSLTEARDAGALDPYVFTRTAYRQRRAYLIHDGAAPAEDGFELLEELEDPAALEPSAGSSGPEAQSR